MQILINYYIITFFFNNKTQKKLEIWYQDNFNNIKIFKNRKFLLKNSKKNLQQIQFSKVNNQKI